MKIEKNENKPCSMRVLNVATENKSNKNYFCKSFKIYEKNLNK